MIELKRESKETKIVIKFSEAIGGKCKIDILGEGDLLVNGVNIKRRKRMKCLRCSKKFNPIKLEHDLCIDCWKYEKSIVEDNEGFYDAECFGDKD